MYVVNVVLPVLLGKWDQKSFSISKHLATTFLIGRHGFAMTAAHVIEQIEESGEDYAVGFIDGDGWQCVRIKAYEKHPTEDVAILHLEAIRHASWMVISTAPENQSCEYDCWGYPAFVAEMPKRLEGAEFDRPELIYTRGYVRRRLSRELPFRVFRGQAFYELSESAGDGCSGGPVILRSPNDRSTWKVFGIYIGSSDVDRVVVGYATRMENVHSWAPQMLGRTILEESRDLA